MKFFLISDNHDTLIGMRMAGVDGVIASCEEDVEVELKKACADADLGVLLITAKLMDMCRQSIYDRKLHGSLPLIVEVADRHGDGKVTNAITRYVSEAVGIKI